jgi:hypothetical protein
VILGLISIWNWVSNAAIVAISYMVKHWRVFLPLLMIGIAWWYVTGLQNERDDAISALNTYVAEAKAAKVKRAADNLDKKRSIDSALAIVDITHESMINEIRKEYDAKVKTTVDLNNANWRKRLRDQVASTTSGVSGIPKTASESSEVGGNSDAAIIGTLETACKITTADYNSLWEAWNKSCEVYGCR